MKKRIVKSILILTILMSVIAILPMSASAEKSGTCGDNLSWEIDEAGTLVINGTGDMTDWLSTSDVPWRESRQSITTVIINSGVTNIGRNAFYNCEKLENIIIPDGIKVIGNSAFWNCKSLTEVVIPEGVTVIEDSAFYACSALNKITIPKSVTSIGRNVFDIYSDAECAIYISDINAYMNISFEGALGTWYNLYLNGEPVTDVVVPDTVTSIGDYTFSGCTSIEKVTLPNSVISIGGSAFSQCSNLSEIKMPEQLTSLGGGAFESCGSLEEVSIPKGITNIGDRTFFYCSNLKKVTIPEGVTSIGGSVFQSCTSLESLSIPSSLESFGSDAFKRCGNIQSIYITDLLSFMNIAFEDGDSAWQGYNLYLNGNLVTDVVIPDTITEIADYAFYGCFSIKNVTLPRNLQSIGDRAFFYCNNLTEIRIPDSVTSIGEYAFYTCGALKSISIGNNVSYMGGAAFEYSGYYWDEENWVNGILYINNYLIKADSSLSGTLSIRNGTRAIAGQAFMSCTQLKKVIIPDTVTRIGSATFWECTSLVDVVLSNSIIYIGVQAFSGCTSLKNINIPKTVTYIDEYAFSSCTSLKSITIPENVTYIGDYAFPHCENLEEIYWNAVSVADLPELPAGFFYSGFFYGSGENSDGIKIILGEKVKRIPAYAFKRCGGIKSVVIPDNIIEIGKQAFGWCENLQTVMIPKSVQRVGEQAFSGCQGDIYYEGSEAAWKEIAVSNGGTEDATMHYNTKYVGERMQLFDDGKEVTAKVTLAAEDEGKLVMVALYKNKVLVDIQEGIYQDDSIILKSTVVDYDETKVLVWGNKTLQQPSYEVEKYKAANKK